MMLARSLACGTCVYTTNSLGQGVVVVEEEEEEEEGEWVGWGGVGYRWW